MITWEGKGRTIDVGGRALVARSVTPTGDGWVATVRLRSQADLTLTSREPSTVMAQVKLWTRPADKGVGMAVVIDREGRPASLASIPMCGCGERGCGHSGRQLDVGLTADELLGVISLLDPLDVRGPLGTERVWFPPGSRPGW